MIRIAEGPPQYDKARPLACAHTSLPEPVLASRLGICVLQGPFKDGTRTFGNFVQFARAACIRLACC